MRNNYLNHFGQHVEHHSELIQFSQDQNNVISILQKKNGEKETIPQKFFSTCIMILIVIVGCFGSCKGQKTFGTKYLKLEKVIPLPAVKGRIDHLDINLKDQVVYVAALGNNTVEAIDLHEGKVIHSIKGLDEPQGVGYIPQTNEIFVANGGNGDCYFYNAHTFEKTGAVHLSSDADDVRYDSIDMKIYVGYGEGGIAVIDANSHRLTDDIKLPAHPEAF